MKILLVLLEVEKAKIEILAVDKRRQEQGTQKVTVFLSVRSQEQERASQGSQVDFIALSRGD